MDKKKIAAIITAVTYLFNPLSVDVVKEEGKKEEVKNKPFVPEPKLWSLTARTFMMDKRWLIQYRLSR